MKRTSFLLILSLVATSCIKPRTNDKPENPKVTERLTNMTKYDVKIKPGNTTFVTLGSDTLCITASETSIWVPKNALQSNGDDALTVSYHEGTDPKAGTSQNWQTIAFEDSPVGDYDYNDLVIHCKYQLSGRKFGIGVHPIALGAGNNIALGCKIFVNDVLYENVLLCNNCRETLFADQIDFINTMKPNFHTNFFKAKHIINDIGVNKMSSIKVVWYIVAGSYTFYAVNDKFGYLDGNKRPYGLIITNTGRTYYQDPQNPNVGSNWFAFPYEANNISDCYPTFNAWITGDAQECDFANPTEGKVINPDTYLFKRQDGDIVRIYYFPTSRQVW